MINITGILTLSFVSVCRLQLAGIRLRNSEKPLISLLVNHAEGRLRKQFGEILLPGISSAEKGADEENSAQEDLNYYHLTACLKEHFVPEDYLFLRAFFAESQEETSFLLRQAQMLQPENLRMHIIAGFMDSYDSDQHPQDVLNHLNSLTENCHLQDVKTFSWLLNLIHTLSDEGSKIINPLEAACYLNGKILPETAVCSLLHYMSERTEARVINKILHHLSHPAIQDNPVFLLVKAGVLYDLNDYETALQWFRIVNLNKVRTDNYVRLEVNYKISVCLKNTNQEGRSILFLRDILFSGDYDGFFSEYYFHVIIDLAGYYMRIGQYREVDRVLEKLDTGILEFTNGSLGEKLYLLLAEKFLMDCNWEEALDYYKKAFELNSCSETEEKIRMLERHL